MKKSNFALSIVAAFVLGTAVGTPNLVATSQNQVTDTVPVESTSQQVIDPEQPEVQLPANPTDRQSHILKLAYSTASQDGYKYPQLLQGIVLKESKAGTDPKYKVACSKSAPCYGVSQITLPTARGVLKNYPQLWKLFEFQTRTDDEVKAKLIENDQFNLAIASKYVMLLHAYGYKTPSEVATAYHLGIGGAENVDASTDPYAKDVLKKVSFASKRG